MKHRTHKTRLDRSSATYRSLLRSLARELILHGAITTTVAKAKALRPYVEKLVSLGKQKTLASRRHLQERLGSDPAARILTTKLADRFASRNGGYTRIIRLTARLGDRAELSRIELVDGQVHGKS